MEQISSVVVCVYGNELISVHPSRQFLSRSIPEAELAVSEGVFRTPDFGLRTRRWMSGYGYKRTFGLAVIHVCFAPESGHPARYEKCNFGQAPEFPLSG